MPNITLDRRFFRVALIAVCTVVSGYQTSYSQTPAPEQGPAYLTFLEERSMLFQADLVDELISGKGVQWRNDFGRPEPDHSKSRLGLAALLSRLRDHEAGRSRSSARGPTRSSGPPNGDVGISLLHTNPTQRAGGIKDREFTPTIDGWFDRIGTGHRAGARDRGGVQPDGRERRSGRSASSPATSCRCTPASGPTSGSPSAGTRTTPACTTWSRSTEEDWGLLPQVDDPWGTALVPREAAVQLKREGIHPRPHQFRRRRPRRPTTWSGWSATPEVVGVDGQGRADGSTCTSSSQRSRRSTGWTRRYAARRVQFGDAARNILGRGVPVLRLDADTFLGLEPQPDSDDASHLSHAAGERQHDRHRVLDPQARRLHVPGVCRATRATQGVRSERPGPVVRLLHARRDPRTR